MEERGATQCAARLWSWKIGACHARPDRRKPPAAFRSNEVLSLPLIAGMAHSTLKSGAATRDDVAFGYRLKDRVGGHPAEDHCPVFVKSGSGCGRLRSPSAAQGLKGRSLNDSGQNARSDRTRIFEPSAIPYLRAIIRHGKPQLPCPPAQMSATLEVIYGLLIAFIV
jgi:hypothetical protein